MNPEKLGEHVQTDVPKAEVVMKICLLASVVLGALLITLAVVGRRSVLDIVGSVVPLVALQWFSYMQARTKEFSQEVKVLGTIRTVFAVSKCLEYVNR